MFVTTVDTINKRISYMGKNLYSGFGQWSCIKVFLGNKRLVLISIALSEVVPNLVSEYMNLTMVEFSRVCVLLYAFHCISSGLQKLKIPAVDILINCSHMKEKKKVWKCRISILLIKQWSCHNYKSCSLAILKQQNHY